MDFLAVQVLFQVLCQEQRSLETHTHGFLHLAFFTNFPPLPETIVLVASPGSLVPPAPPCSDVALPEPWISQPSAALRLSTPSAQSSVPPAPPQSLGTLAPRRTLVTVALPWPPGSSVSPILAGSSPACRAPLPPASSPSVIQPGVVSQVSTMAPFSLNSAMTLHTGCALGPLLASPAPGSSHCHQHPDISHHQCLLVPFTRIREND
ncbi:hypothetical protein DPX16_12495 [Anabarilius grahami]|uniref:Uncharacterized protein n=1 Tax=Anabarilius grahami TaxID=495550 RepID=A0A3N0Y020_ANAGA|nr:hypothetical protein DPX16_12495 [Anabarilius grahami]